MGSKFEAAFLNRVGIILSTGVISSRRICCFSEFIFIVPLFFRLDTGHIDLYLMHSPYGGDILHTYDAMLERKAEGLIKFVL